VATPVHGRLLSWATVRSCVGPFSQINAIPWPAVWQNARRTNAEHGPVEWLRSAWRARIEPSTAVESGTCSNIHSSMPSRADGVASNGCGRHQTVVGRSGQLLERHHFADWAIPLPRNSTGAIERFEGRTGLRRCQRRPKPAMSTQARRPNARPPCGQVSPTATTWNCRPRKP
jgi:hypothetical protein